MRTRLRLVRFFIWRARSRFVNLLEKGLRFSRAPQHQAVQEMAHLFPDGGVHRTLPEPCVNVTLGGERPMNPAMVTTANEIPGYRIVQNLGVVRGITVRSRSVLGNFAGGIQTLFGGNITIFTELCEHARLEAFQLLVEHAQAIGANAIIGVRYDANDVMDGVTEVLAYGTAVVVEKT
jgi:uncharacterized protein YbjQ (UPF0145 family)